MLFNSYIFIFGFLPITFFVFFGLTKFRLVGLASVWLTLASLFFYAYWNITYLPLLLISIGINYQIGKQLSLLEPRRKLAKILLGVGLAFNLGLLAYYKYASFLVSNLPIPAFRDFLDTHLSLASITLPLAISFFTFQQLAYLVDAYKGETKEYSFLNYCLFVTFFPQLIAGPIISHGETIPQFHRLKNLIFSHRNVALGLAMFTMGLFKKAVIADSLSPWVGSMFAHARDANFLEAWIGTLSYTLQLYFDFSGYSDMAIGLGLLFNIHLPFNFDSPYKSQSIVEFWRRWHITLSNFLRDYLYIPLGGNRLGQVRRYVNLMITMLLGGLWHGAGWTFVIWGGLHGAYLVINHAWRKLKIPMPALLAWAITFAAVMVGWVFFRAPSLREGLEILQTLVGLKGIVLPQEVQMLLPAFLQSHLQFVAWEALDLQEFSGNRSVLFLLGLLLCVTRLPNTQQILQRFQPTVGWAIGLGLTAAFSLLALNRVSEFLYFQF